MSHQPRHVFAFVLSMPLCLFVFAGCGLFPFAAGQHETSPDGRYDAKTMYYSTDQRECLVLTITDVHSGKVIWEEDLGTLPDGDRPPYDQGIGWLDLIQWSDDSGEARFAYSFPQVQSSGKEQVAQWLIVKLDGKGNVTATETVPGSRFRTVDPKRIVGGDQSEEQAESEQPQDSAKSD